MENTNIKEWYKEMSKNEPYKEDYKLINDSITFYDLFKALDNYQNIYDFLGEDIDTFIRENIFAKLAEIMGVDYDDIYNQWLLCDN